MRSPSESYYIKEKLDGFSLEERGLLAKALEDAGFEFYEPQMGGGGGAKIVEQIIASLNFNNVWFDIFVGVVANRLDSALSAIFAFISKHKSKIKQKPVVEAFIYTPIRGKNNCYYIKFDADKKHNKKEIVQLLKQMKKTQGDNYNE